MKKIFISALIMLAALPMSAQNESKMKAYAGVGFASVVGSDADTKTALSYKVGVSYDLNFSEKFAIVPAVEFVNKTHKTDGIDGTINKMYLQVPVLAAYKFNVTESAKISVMAGPYVAYGIAGSDIEFAGGGKINVFDDDVFKRFDAGILAGVSVDFDQLSVGLLYSRGLAKLNSDLKVYNQAFGLVLGYRF